MGSESNIMEEKILKGIISFVNYEKHFATIEYEVGAKKKSVNCKTGLEETGRKTQHFRIGDTVKALARVASLDMAKRRARFACHCEVNGKIVVEGEATVFVPSRG